MQVRERPSRLQQVMRDSQEKEGFTITGKKRMVQAMKIQNRKGRPGNGPSKQQRRILEDSKG